MNIRNVLSVCLALVLFALPSTGGAQTASKDADIVHRATTVFDEIMGTPDNAIPKAVLENAEAIAVFPGLLRAAFVFGGQRGRGIISVRDAKTGTWSSPAFMTITGGSWGAQIGGESIDLVLVIRDRQGVSGLLSNQFKIGGEASAAAGPVGRSAEAATDVQMHAKILSYSRSRGLFVGLAVNGSTVRQDWDANERVYGTRYAARDIVIAGAGGSPDGAGLWRDTLTKYTK